MKDSKNFFYRINPCEVLAEVIFADNKEKWFLQFFSDLKNDDPEQAQLELSKHIITEAHEFRAKRSVAGKASAEQRVNKKKHMLTDVATNVQHNSTSSSSSSSSSSSTVSEAKAVTETESKSLKPFVQNREADFVLFWNAFSYKEGKGGALKSWMAIKGYSQSLLHEILRGAERETKRRSLIIQSGKTPKMAQGWLTERRWEDEPLLSQGQALSKVAGGTLERIEELRRRKADELQSHQ